ncbi:hypothetical protein WNY61_07855 [Sulfitobacter sp. AS92]|uniref:hypothetical protein n=1 Tax=Sulfitobacter sp. AS92 TaxID=3135783 RepID=UPI003172D3C8
MGLFSSATQAATAVVMPTPKTMQTVFDETSDGTERKRIARLSKFFAAPLSTLDGGGVDLLTWFENNFQTLKQIGTRPLPGSDREFWKSESSYAKWREVVCRRIKTTLGMIAAKQVLRKRIDGWRPFLALLEELSKDHGPVHPGTFGSIRTFSDRARAAGIDPMDLTPNIIPAFLDGMPAHEREASIKALRALGRHRIFPQVAGFLPENFDTDYLIPTARTPVPDTVREMIAEMVEAARYDRKTFDDVSQTCSENFNAKTAQTYTAALVALARAGQETNMVNLSSLNCLDQLFKSDVRIAVIRHWIDMSETDARFSLRTAAGYVRIIAQIGKADGLKTKKWVNSLKKNPHLREGHASGEKMSPKNRIFCENLIHNSADVRTFLRQHVLYQDRAKDILATDKTLTTLQLRSARRFATCAAFAAIEIRGAGLRKGSALTGECGGTTQNFFRKTVGEEKYFELRVAQKDMKGEYIEMPPIRIRDDQYCGYEVLDWYLKAARPLFDFANPEHCEAQKCPMATHLFVSEQSANPLNGAMLYKWFRRSSAEIGLPMFPHNFRHGFATLLLARSWSNRGRAAAYLGCSTGVLETYYGWIDKRQKLEEVQDLLAEALAGK